MSERIFTSLTFSSRVAVPATLALMMWSCSGCHSTLRENSKSTAWRTAAWSSPRLTDSRTELTAEAPVQPEAQFQEPEVPGIPPLEPALSEEEVVSIFREAGGKLRPNDAGEIVEIDLSFSSITDSQLRSVDRFPEVSELDLTGTQIHDESLTVISALPALRAVKLKGTKIENPGLQALSGLSSLILLDASNTAVSDEGLRDAAGWISLRYLSLNHTSVTDEGLKYLESLRELKGLSIIDTQVTEEGVRALKEKLPNCLIVAQSSREVSGAPAEDRMPRLSESGPLESATAGLTSRSQLIQVTQLASQQPHLAVHLSKIYASRDQWHEAAEVLSAAAAAKPDDRSLQYSLGEALARSGRPEEGLSHFEQAVDPAAARYQVALIVYENSLKKCERLFDQALSANPRLEAAEARRQEIQNELAQLTRKGTAAPQHSQSHEPFEVVPAPPVRNASHSRPWSLHPSVR